MKKIVFAALSMIALSAAAAHAGNSERFPEPQLPDSIPSLSVPVAALPAVEGYGSLTRWDRNTNDYKLSLYFDSAQDELNFALEKDLDKLVERLERYTDYDIMIVGHTDEIGKAEDNVALSLARAQAAAQYLNKTGFIPLAKISVEARGEREPIVIGTSDYRHMKNRRVDITVKLHN